LAAIGSAGASWSFASAVAGVEFARDYATRAAA